MSQAINMAVENIQQDIELRKATSADLRLGLTYLILGISSILLLSLILGGPAQQIIDVPQLKANNATRLIVKLRAIQTDHTLLFLLVVGGTMAGIRYLLNNVSEFRGLWGVRQLDDLLKARRSANFLAAWMPLFASGFSPDKSLNLIAKNNSGTNKLAVESIMDGVEQGATIPQSLLAQYWSPSFIIGMKAFDAAHDEARHKLLVRIKGMLITEIFVTGKRFSKLALHIGMISAVFTVFLIAAGFYAPMLLSRGG
jgi:type II secretory pathway component PulF